MNDDGRMPGMLSNVESNPVLIRGDARGLIKTIPDQSVDLILTDPPYNLNPYSRGNIKFAQRKALNNDVASWDQADFDPEEWLADFRRILKPTGNLFAFTCYNAIGRWHASFDPAFDTFHLMVWHKTNPPPKIRKTSFLNSCEWIVCVWNRGHTWNFLSQKEMHNFIETPLCMGKERTKNPVHPTQKPLRVLRHIISIASNPGDLVFDPFMGVGSTGVAALELNRRFAGFEIEENYFRAATNRILQVWNEPPLEIPGDELTE
jgi:DNA modification methylase